jgi:hypothetical protein
MEPFDDPSNHVNGARRLRNSFKRVPVCFSFCFTSLCFLLFSDQTFVSFCFDFCCLSDEEISLHNEWRVWSFLKELIQYKLNDKTTSIEVRNTHTIPNKDIYFVIE